MPAPWRALPPSEYGPARSQIAQRAAGHVVNRKLSDVGPAQLDAERSAERDVEHLGRNGCEARIRRTAVAGVATRVVAWILSAAVGAEMTTLISTGEVTGPLWFDVIAGASLVAGVFAGAIVFLRWKERGGVSTVSAQPDAA